MVYGHALFAEMDSVGVCCECDVKAVVDENAWLAALAGDGSDVARCFARQFRQRSRGQLLFAKLDPVDARGGDGGDLLK